MAESSKDTTALAQEVMELIEGKIGTPVMMAALSKIRSQVDEVGRKRRLKRRLDAVNEPEKEAKRRYAKNQGKRNQKKRKAELARRMRGR